MYNKVELCGVNTGQLPVLTEAEKRQLLTLAHAGDKAARARMVEGNLRLVLSVVQRFAQRGENLDDLFQVGCIGLIKAIDNFDPAQPVRFSTYGVPMIIGEIRRFLRDNNALRVSRTLRDTAYRAMQARETLEKQLGREPTMDEIAAVGVLRRRRCHVCDRPGAGPGQRGKLDQRVAVPRYGSRPFAPGKAHHGAAVSARQDPDGGGAGDRHQSGAGKPAGKRRITAVSHRGMKAAA